MTNSKNIPQKCDDVLSQTEADVTMLARQGIEGAYVLNDTSALIWDLIDGKMSADELSRLLENAFSDSSTQVRADVEAVLNSFTEAKLIKWR